MNGKEFDEMNKNKFKKDKNNSIPRWAINLSWFIMFTSFIFLGLLVWVIIHFISKWW